MPKEPYNTEDISTVPCVKCGKPSFFQWQLNGCCLPKKYVGEYFGVCPDCDIELNKHTIEFRNIPDGQKILNRYIKKVRKSVAEAVAEGTYKESW